MDSLRIVLAALCFTYVIATGPESLTIEKPDKSELSVGETLTLTCLVPGNDEEPSWYKDGMSLTAGDRIAIEHMHDGDNMKSKLTVTSLVAADGGAYKCAFVPGMDESMPVRIIVSEAAAAGGSVEIQEPEVETLHINIGATFTLKCQADAGVSISWQKDGVALTDSEANYVITPAELSTGSVSLLSAESAQESDSGVFTCMNDNDAADSDEVTVHVAKEHEHEHEHEEGDHEHEHEGHEHEHEEGDHEHEQEEGEEGVDAGASMVTTFTLHLLLACLAALL